MSPHLSSGYSDQHLSRDQTRQHGRHTLDPGPTIGMLFWYFCHFQNHISFQSINVIFLSYCGSRVQGVSANISWVDIQTNISRVDIQTNISRVDIWTNISPTRSWGCTPMGRRNWYFYQYSKYISLKDGHWISLPHRCAASGACWHLSSQDIVYLFVDFVSLLSLFQIKSSLH